MLIIDLMTASRKRPFLVTFLALGVLILTVFNAVRFGSALAQWDLILDFMPLPGPIYIAATGLIWTLGWLIVFLSLYLGWKWARQTTLTIPVFYTIYYWFDRLVFQAAVERSNTTFAIIATFLCLAFVVIILALPKSREYFTKKNDESEM